MFDVPLDAWYAWLGVALASTAVYGAATGIPAVPPPDATGVAATVDDVAASEYPATAERPIAADAIRLGPHRVGLRNDGGTSHAAFAFGPVTPVPDDSRLQAVLHGTPPPDAFESQTAFQQAVIDARTSEPRWRTVDRTLVVRRVTWGGFDVTLVDA